MESESNRLVIRLEILRTLTVLCRFCSSSSFAFRPGSELEEICVGEAGISPFLGLSEEKAKKLFEKNIVPVVVVGVSEPASTKDSKIEWVSTKLAQWNVKYSTIFQLFALR